MKILSKFDFKINVIPNKLGKYVSFSLDNMLVFIDSFESLSSSLDSSVKNLRENDFKHLSQEFYSEVGLVKQKGFYPRKYMYHFEKSKEKLHLVVKGLLIKFISTFGINLKS